MEHSDLLRHMGRVLQDMGLRYFVTGSTATIFYGEPRFTNDIDIVVDLPAAKVVEFCRRFPPDEFYVSEAAARDAVRNKSQFNIIHPDSGLKVDVIVPALDAFNESRFIRAKRIRITEADAFFASPEDTIIKKMDYYREGGSEKHLRDIIGVLRSSQVQIDLPYVEQWVRQLGLNEVWAAIRKKMDQDQ